MGAPTVTFFGYTLTVPDDGYIEPPLNSVIAYTGTGWNATLFKDSNVLKLNLGGFIGSQRVYVVADVECDLNNGVWTPVRVHDGAEFWVLPINEISPQQIDLRLGSLDLEKSDDHGLSVRDGKIVIEGKNLKHTWFTDPASPLSLTVGTMPIDLARGVAQIDSDTFVLKTSAIQITAKGQVECFVRNHAPRGIVEIPLGRPPTQLSVIYDAMEKKALPLHVDLLERGKPIGSGNPLAGALSIDGYALQVDLRRSKANTIATAVTAQATGTGLALTTHFLSDQLNSALVWQGPGSIALGLRAGDSARPGSLFVISPNFVLQPTILASTPIHGVAADAEFAFEGPATVLLDTNSEPKRPTAKGFDASILREVTYPYLRWPNFAKAARPVTLMHAGRSTLADQALAASGAAIEPVGLSGSTLALPIVDSPRLSQTGATASDHARFIDSLLASPAYALVPTTHDSGRAKLPPGGGSTMALRALFATGEPNYQPFGVVYRVGPRFTIEYKDDGTVNDYLIIDPKKVKLTCIFDQLLGDDNSPFKITASATSGIAGILKFSRAVSLEDIFVSSKLGSIPFASGDPINNPSWVGLLLLNLTASTNERNELNTLFGSAPFEMPYLAVTARDGTGEFDFTAALKFKTSDSLSTPTHEANFAIDKVDAFWRSSTLQKLDIDGTLNVGQFLGLTLNPSPQISISGRYDRKTKTVQFASKFAPIELLPGTVQGAPLKSLQINSVDVTFGNGSAGIVANGSVSVTDFALGKYPIAGPGAPVDFRGLSFPFKNPPGLKSIEIDIGYPSLELNRDNVSFNWGSLEISLIGISMVPDEASWLSIPELDIGGVGNPPNARSVAITLSISLMKLPALSAKSVDRLTLVISVGMLPSGGNWNPHFWARIQALDFNNLDLDLLQFMTIKIGTLRMDTAGKTVKFVATGVKVDVLNHRILEDLELIIFDSDGTSGFAAFAAPAKIVDWFQVSWLLAGHNISLLDDNELVARLITINPQSGDDPDDLGRLIGDEFLKSELIPAPGSPSSGRWLFGGGIKVADNLLVGRAIFQDEGFCGIALRSDLMKEWFNLDFSIGVAYRRGARAEQDTFFVSLAVPQVTLPAFDFMGGVISLDIAMNGDFKLDVGFPRLGADRVARAWDRSFGAVVGIFQGSGGFYLTKGMPGIVQTTKTLRLGGGYAVQAGFGAAFGAGIFSVVVTIGVYAIVEGDFVVEDRKLVQFVLSGAIGILFRGVGQLNWWVISVSVSIVVAAEARATIAWTAEGAVVSNPLPGAPAPGKMQIDFDFTVYASVSAQACIGGRWFHICRSIGVTIPMRVHYPVQIGKI